MIFPSAVVRNARNFLSGMWEGGFELCVHIHKMSLLVWQTSIRSYLFVKNVDLTLRQMYVIGVESIPLVAVISVFIGGEAVIQAQYQFSGFIPMRYLGFAVCKTLVAELCPVITSIVVSGRVSTAIAAEIGSMRTSEQLDAMTCLSLDSVRYLIVPKVLGAMIMMPILVIISELVAFLFSILVAVTIVDVTMHMYLQGLRLFFSSFDMIVGIIKTSVFGAIIAFTGAHFGYEARKGAKGIGESTTRAVMISALLILVFDFIIAYVLLR